MSRVRTRNTKQIIPGESMQLKFVNPSASFNDAGRFGTIPSGTSFRAFSAIGAEILGEISSIDDAINTAGHPLSYNPVTHSKELWACPKSYWNNSWTYKAHPVSGLPVKVSCETFQASSVQMLSLLALPPLTGQATLAAQASSQLKPGSPKEAIDVPRFLAELKDLDGLLRGNIANITDLHTAWKRGAGRMGDKSFGAVCAQLYIPYGRRVPPGAVRRSESSLSKLFQLDLAYKFMIKPLVDESMKITQCLSRMQQTLESLKKEDITVLRGRSSAQVSGSEVFVSNDYHRHLKEQSVERTCVAWSIVKRDWTSVTEAQYFRSMFAITPRIQTVWELVPLSFVLDMVVDVGKWLSQFDGSALTVPYTVRESGLSYKDVTTTTVSTFPFKGHAWLGPTMPSFSPIRGVMTKKSYNRTVTALSFDSHVVQPLDIRLPNLGQIGTLLEMLYLMMRS